MVAKQIVMMVLYQLKLCIQLLKYKLLLRLIQARCEHLAYDATHVGKIFMIHTVYQLQHIN